jgi:glycosyltransferase involved in cell wall biosynthesis
VNKVAVYIISDGIGGAEQVVWQTINALKSYPEIFLIVNNEIAEYYSELLDSKKFLNIGNIYLHRNPALRPVRYLLNNRFFSIKPVLVRSKTKAVYSFVRANGIGVIHAHMEFALFSALNIKRHFRDVKIIYTVHSAFGFLGDKSLKPQHWINKKEFSDVDIFVFVSRYNLNLFTTNNVPVKNFRLIYNSINLNLLPDNLESRTKDGNFHILYVGGAKYVKGYDLLVAAIKRLISLNKLSNLKVTILGDVHTESHFANMINDNVLSSVFSLMGFVLPPGHYKYFQQADLLFMPSRSEAMPMAAVEALFFNLPVVASNVGGLSEIVSHGENGYLCSPDPVEFADTIFHSIQNYDKLLISTKRHNESIRKVFDSDIVMKQVSELYSNINEVSNNGR